MSSGVDPSNDVGKSGGKEVPSPSPPSSHSLPRTSHTSPINREERAMMGANGDGSTFSTMLAGGDRAFYPSPPQPTSSGGPSPPRVLTATNGNEGEGPVSTAATAAWAAPSHAANYFSDGSSSIPPGIPPGYPSLGSASSRSRTPHDDSLGINTGGVDTGGGMNMPISNPMPQDSMYMMQASMMGSSHPLQGSVGAGMTPNNYYMQPSTPPGHYFNNNNNFYNGSNGPVGTGGGARIQYNSNPGYFGNGPSYYSSSWMDPMSGGGGMMAGGGGGGGQWVACPHCYMNFPPHFNKFQMDEHSSTCYEKNLLYYKSHESRRKKPRPSSNTKDWEFKLKGPATVRAGHHNPSPSPRDRESSEDLDGRSKGRGSVDARVSLVDSSGAGEEKEKEGSSLAMPSPTLSGSGGGGVDFSSARDPFRYCGLCEAKTYANKAVCHVCLNQKRTTSTYRGVCHNRGKWQVQINAGGKRHYLGYFSSETEAAKVYDVAALYFHGPKARLNFDIETAQITPRSELLEQIIQSQETETKTRQGQDAGPSHRGSTEDRASARRGSSRTHSDL